MIKTRGGDPAQKPARKPAAKKPVKGEPRPAAKKVTPETMKRSDLVAPAKGPDAGAIAKALASESVAADAIVKDPITPVETAQKTLDESGVFTDTGGKVFEIHPMAEAYPHMADEIYQPFKEGLLRHGQHQPIDVIPHPTNDNILQIIDGRHRYIALSELDMPVKYKFYDGPIGDEHLREFVESQNVHRRDLSQAQRAMSAAKLYTGSMGRPKKVSPDETDMTDVVAEEIAKRNGVGLSTFRKAVRVNRLAKRFPEFVEHVFEGRIELAPAYDMVADFEQTDTKLKRLNITTNDFKKLAEAPSAIGEILRRAKIAEKKQKRDDRDEKIKEISTALPDEEFQVVYLDPPWKFEARSENGMDRSAENHYPTMEFKDIIEAKPALADKAVVFLWVTNPFLAHAFDLLTAWDLTYKSNMVWHKDKMGTGYWNRQNHEILIIATTEKGFPAPAAEDLMPSCETFPRGKHSEKPTEYAEWIEKVYPTAKKLEMYCRSPREGWEHWGNESSGVSLLEQVSQREEAEDLMEGEMDEEDDMLAAQEEQEKQEALDDAKKAPHLAEDEDGFFDPAKLSFLKSKDPLNTNDDEPPGL